MEMVLSEEKVREIWSDEKLLTVIAGCKHIVVDATVSRNAKHLVLTPTGIVFDDWSIGLGEEMLRELERVVDIVPLPEKTVE
jgi:hypothetical protein